MQGAVEQHFRRHPDRQDKSVAQVALALAGIGRVDGQHQRLRAGLLRPPDQVEVGVAVALGIELEPETALRRLADILDRGGCRGAQIYGTWRPGGARQAQVGIRPDQVAHAGRRDADGAVPGPPEQRLLLAARARYRPDSSASPGRCSAHRCCAPCPVRLRPHRRQNRKSPSGSRRCAALRMSAIVKMRERSYHRRFRRCGRPPCSMKFVSVLPCRPSCTPASKIAVKAMLAAMGSAEARRRKPWPIIWSKRT